MRFKSGAYLVYFQAYTTTFARTALLKEQIEIAISVEGIKGIVIGTRPDCISEALLDYLNELSKKDIFIALELGVQSFQENQLKWLERGHSSKKAIESIKRIKEKTKVDLGIHLMFGLPDESDDDVISAAKIINQLPLDNVKLHNLHVLKNTPLEKLYEHKLFKPIERQEYIDRVIVFLEHLNPKIAVHRLAAVASRHNELVAPKWAASKMETYQMSLDEFHRRNTFQGRLFTP